MKLLLKVISRYAPSRTLSFDLVHVFKALQLMINNYASRALLVKELGLGEGSVRTLIKHMKMYGLVETSKKGTKLTETGRSIYQEISSIIINECELPSSSVTVGRFNYAILLKCFSKAIRFGVEQRDAAIKIGALGATTLIYKNKKFVMPTQTQDSSPDDPIRSLLMNLKPNDGDVIIIGSANDKLSAELAAKNAGLMTIIGYMKRIANL